jgi:hypothetical protein
MEKECLDGKVVIYMKVHILMIWGMDMEKCDGQMEVGIKVNGNLGSKMA